jgi:hypothetical protein
MTQPGKFFYKNLLQSPQAQDKAPLLPFVEGDSKQGALSKKYNYRPFVSEVKANF